MNQSSPDPSAMAQAFDLQSLPAEFYTDPFPYYQALRTHDPVKLLPGGGYFLTRYNDCLAVYKDPVTFSSDKKKEFKPKYGDTLIYEHHTTSLVFNDPPLHTRVRKLILGALVPRAISKMEPGLIALVDGLIEQMAQKQAAGQTVDLIGDFASAIPVEIIGNLLNVPKDERGPLRGWSLKILGALEPKISSQQLQAADNAVREFSEYLDALIATRRKSPGDPETDVLTRLIEGEVDGERLTHKELLQNCIFILNAGHETTTNLIGNCLMALLKWPDEKAKLIASPKLIKSAIEEVLRYESSNQLGNRMTTTDTKIGGVSMSAGTSITICIGAANRDPEMFENPEEFLIERTPNRHLAFGSGIHQCAGITLARLEGQIAVAMFLKKFPNFELSDKPTTGGRVRFRGYQSIPVNLGTTG